MAQKKMGRPKSDNPLNYEVKARLDKSTFDKLNCYCKKNELERATIIRKSICLFLKDEK